MGRRLLLPRNRAGCLERLGTPWVWPKLGVGISPSRVRDPFAFPISNLISVIKPYGQATWRDLFLAVTQNYVQYEVYYLLN